jgi:AcrR family transcriptional regulator
VSARARTDRHAVTRDERRQTLLDAGRALFERKGYHATTVDDITREAGVAKGTFYLYFDEKRDLFYEVIRGFMALVKDIGASVRADDSSPHDFFARVERAAQRLMAIFVENRELARLAYRESMGLDPRLEEMLAGFYREIAGLQADNVRAAVQLGLIRDVDPLLCAYAHIGMVERVLLALIAAPGDFPPPEVVVRELVALAFDGLRRAP